MASPWSSWNASTARLIYKLAAETAKGNQALFEQLAVQDLLRHGFAIPKRFAVTAARLAGSTASAASPRVAAATPTVAKVGIAATAVALAPWIAVGIATVGAIGVGVYTWRRYATWPK